MFALAAAAMLTAPVAAHVAPLRSTIANTADVGRRGAGWTCFPAGAIRWRDLAFDPDEGARIVAATLAARGIAAEDGMETAENAVRVVATIRAAEAKACAPRHGLGKLIGVGGKLRGRIVLTIDWIVRRPGSDPRRLDTRTTVEMETRRDDFGEFLERALVAATDDMAARWTATDDDASFDRDRAAPRPASDITGPSGPGS